MRLPADESLALCRQFDLLHEDELADESWNELDERFRAEPEVRRLYVRYMRVCAGLTWDFGGLTQNDRVVSRAAAEEPPRSQRAAPHAWQHLSPRGARPSSRASLLAAMLLVAILFYGPFVFVAWNLRPEPVHQDDGSTMATTEAPAVELTAARDCRWVVGDTRKSPTVGARWQANEELELQSGIAQLAFCDGAVVRLEGPARMRVRSGSKGYLEVGQLVAVVPRRAVGFTVETDAANIVDLGTEFAVEVSRRRSTEVHVLSGQVQVVQEIADGPARTTQLAVGQAMRFEPGTDAVTMPASRTKFSALVASSVDDGDEHQARRLRRERLQNDPELAARFACGEQSEQGNRLINLAGNSDCLFGTLMAGTKAGDGRWSGPRWTATPDRRRDGNAPKALWFNGGKDHVAFETFDHGRELTIAAWIHPLKAEKLTILYHNMDFAHDKNGFYLAINPNFNPEEPIAGGELLLAVHDGANREYLARTAPACATYGRWQHVALVVDADQLMARIYRDGVEVARSSVEPGSLQMHTSGKWCLGCEDEGDFAFSGLIDDVLIFRRVLGPEEIADLANRDAN